MAAIGFAAASMSACCSGEQARVVSPINRFFTWLQSKAAQGRDPQSTPLHVCQCPSCFSAFAKSNGVIECVPKCDLADCDEDTGVCSEAGSGTGKPVLCLLSV